jgi:hypothetical protein
MAGNGEGPLTVAEDLDLALLVGLDPDDRFGIADVAEDRAKKQLRHAYGDTPARRRRIPTPR